MMPSNHLILCHPRLIPYSIFPSIRVLSLFFSSGGQSTGASASSSVLPKNIQSWFLLGLTGLILKLKGLWRVFSNTTIKKHQFFGTQLSFSFLAGSDGKESTCNVRPNTVSEGAKFFENEWRCLCSKLGGTGITINSWTFLFMSWLITFIC